MRRAAVVAVAVLGAILASCSSTGPAGPPRAVHRPTTTTTAPSGHCLEGYLPSPRCTPGTLNPAVTPATISTTICKKGWTSTVRPLIAVSSKLKTQASKTYAIAGYNPANYEGDHFVPLELGGATATLGNFWDEPHSAAGPDGKPAGSFVKDAFENWLNFQVCHRGLPLATAQQEIAINWYAAYEKAGRPPDPYNPNNPMTVTDS